MLVLLLLALLLAWERWDSHAEIDAAERARLAGQVRAIERNLTHQFLGVDAALRGMRADLSSWPAAQLEALAGQRLKALCDAMPGVRSMHVFDVSGTILASSLPQLVGNQFADRGYFRRIREQPDAARLYVSAPFVTALGVQSLSLSVALTGPRGEFAGVVAATLDPEYFNTVLDSVLYAPDMRGAVAHGGGQVLLSNPLLASAQNLNLAQPGSFFSRHLQSGQPATVLTGTALASADERMVAQRTLQPPELTMDQPLVLSVSRNLAAVFAAWQRQTAISVLLLAAGSLGAWFALWALQRRRQQLEDLARQTAAQHAADAERVTLALRGGDLALWDAHIPSRQGVVNERWYSMLGYAKDEVAADETGWKALLHPDDSARVTAAQDAHLRGDTEAYEATYRLRHRAGHWVWVLDRGRVVERDTAGRPVRMVGTHMDVSERVAAEDTLRRSEQSLAITLHSIGDAVIATDPQGLVTRINATAERLTGWPAAEALGRPLRELFRIFNARTREPVLDPVALVLERGEVVGIANDTVLVARDGSEHQIADSAAPIRSMAADGSAQVLGVVLVFSDVTEHYRMLQALRDREAQLDRVTAALPGPVARLDREGRYLFTNATCERWFGRADHQVLGRNWRDIYPPEVQAVIEPEMLLALGGQPRSFDVSLPTLGGPREAMVSLVPDQDDDGTVRGCFVVVNDITERKLAQAELQRSEDRLRMASRMARLGGWRRDLLLNQAMVSPELAAIMELEPDHRPQVGGSMEFVALNHRELLRQRTDACINEGQAFDIEVAAHTRLGRPLHLRLLGEAVRDSNGRVVALQGAAQDITELHLAQQQMRQLEDQHRTLERQLRDSQKMDSIGTLAGGIAHDFNNILPAILGNVALARAELPPSHAAQRSLEQINRAAHRARSLVQQILTFSRRQPNTLQAQPLRPVVEETLALLRTTLPAPVRLDTLLAEETLVVEADATQLQQVLMNLCTNAWHALEEKWQGGGRIEVGLEGLADAEGRLALPQAAAGLPPGPCVHLWVSDNGSGMDAAVRARIFDPFFTTKPVGRGTGLGLSVVHGIVRSHRGAITVDSTPGQGSSFHLYFPLQSALGDAPAAGSSVLAAPQGNGQRVLYVDDDEVMVVLAQSLLERAGYTVVVCHSAAEALAQVQAQPLDLVVSDYNMPEMSGLDLARALQQLRPQLPLIITSGNLTPDMRLQAKAAGVQALLRKENTLEQLSGLVQQVLTAVQS